jgi:large subunit ribosomal protein L31e
LSDEKKVSGEGEEKLKGIEFTIKMPRKIKPRKKRAKIVLSRIREEASHIVRGKNIRISPELAEMVWSRGIENPPKILKMSIRVEDEEDFATVLPAEVERKD